jgi:hypothetical protein
MSNEALADLKKAMTREVVGPFTGITYKIRKLRAKELVNYMQGLPLTIAEPIKQDLEQFAKTLDAEATKNPEIAEKSDQYILRCVLSPKIHFGDPEQCPEDQVPFDYLGNDVDILIMNIIHLSNNAPDLGGSGVNGAFLSNTVSGPTGPSEPEVRPEAVEPAPE